MSRFRFYEDSQGWRVFDSKLNSPIRDVFYSKGDAEKRARKLESEFYEQTIREEDKRWWSKR